MKEYPHTDDIVRSRTMSRIKSKNTSIEVSLRKALWHSGVRYRKNYSKLPGKPDIAVTKHHVAIFCDGEFWHGKDWETKRPNIQNNRDYWLSKIERNMARDDEANKALTDIGWTVVRFWGTEINKNLEGCIKTVESVIAESQTTGSDAKGIPSDDLYAALGAESGSLKVAEEQSVYQVDGQNAAKRCGRVLTPAGVAKKTT